MTFRQFLPFAIALTCAGTLFSNTADETEAFTAPVPKQSIRLSVPQDLKHLLIPEPHVDVLLLIDESGYVKDYIALASNHFSLLKPAERLIEGLRFEPALQNGEPVPVRHQIRIQFEDFQQQMWRDSGRLPMGSVATDGTGRKFFDQAPDAYVYQQSEVAELDAPLQLKEGALRVVEGPNGEAPKGSCLIEFYVDAEGKVRLPSVMESDNELASLSGLASLRSMRFEPPRKNLRPTWVKVRQRFRFGEP